MEEIKNENIESNTNIEEMMNRDVTIGIKTFFRRACLNRCIQTARKFYPKMRIIVADDSPTDIKEKNQNRFKDDPFTRILSLPFDIGLAAGRNKFVNECETKYILIVDDDTIFTPQTRIDVLYRFLTSFDQYDLAAGYGRKRKTGGYGCKYLKVVSRKKDGKKILLYRTGQSPEIDTKNVVEKGFRFYDTDRCLNYFLAKKESLIRHPWDPKLKIAEHQDFFVRAWLKKSLKVAMSPQVIFDEKRENCERYNKYRKKRALKFVGMAENKTYKCVDIKDFKGKKYLSTEDRKDLGLPVKTEKKNQKNNNKKNNTEKKNKSQKSNKRLAGGIKYQQLAKH